MSQLQLRPFQLRKGDRITIRSTTGGETSMTVETKCKDTFRDVFHIYSPAGRKVSVSSFDMLAVERKDA